MVVKSKIEGSDEWLFSEYIADTFIMGNTISEKRTKIERSLISMENYRLSGGGLFLMHSEMRFAETVRVHLEVIGETVTSQFVFYYPVSSKKTTFQGASKQNIRFVSSSNSSYELKAGVDYTYFLMVLSKAYYHQLIDRHSSLQEGFMLKTKKGTGIPYTSHDRKVTSEMQRIILELSEEKMTGELKRLHTKAKVLELLIYQIEQLNSEWPEERQLFKETDIQKLEMAKQLLETSFTDPPTQKKLAQQVMLNESKLRKGFKEYFATTIYDYITRLRMEMAKKLLLEQGKTIYEVSILAGFRHQSNFSVAFKKYFGVSPSEIS